jgi:thiamine monophosphate kinase
VLKAISGGKDDELLFAVPQAACEKLLTNPDTTIIGYMTEPEKKNHIIYCQGRKYV